MAIHRWFLKLHSIFIILVATYVLAPVPNWIFSKCSANDDYYLSSNSNSGYKDFGQFLTSIFIVTGVCLPIVLAHASVIPVPAMFMSIGGVIAYSTFFANEGEDF
ncbi:23502_t:CDS:2 [Racocetra persica]|uniref:23502_t:CDS:1 n=1 Tax=Racocetra persica TaxID=160502 RepID=A0ACA9KZK5_9GLOM|nr:23502_t:CDS:2 [Racocetra persica]